MNYEKDILGYFEKLKQTIDKISTKDLSDLMNVLETARDESRTIFIMGNGGSAATASHYVCDFNKGISLPHPERKPYKFICLNDNVPTMMAYANDLSYSDVFAGPLQNFYREGDVVIAISGSGNSANVVKAARWARDHAAVTVALTGYDGGQLRTICQHNVNIPIDDMQITEDLHMVLDHCMMKILAY